MYSLVQSLPVPFEAPEAESRLLDCTGCQTTATGLGSSVDL